VADFVSVWPRDLVFRFWVGMGRCLSLFDVMRDLCGICDGVSGPGASRRLEQREVPGPFRTNPERGRAVVGVPP
jgi:hypothetical protein